MPEAETPPHRYDAALAAEIEARWQQRWRDARVYEAPNPSGSLSDPGAASRPGPKLFIMDMFPYPSGSGLHVGHPLGYIATDVYARFKRMTGFNVLHTLGFDAFGLPAEEHARQTGQHPRQNTEANIANMSRQLARLGLGHDPRRAVATTDVSYYRWTQWIFLQIFESWFDPDANRARPVAELIDEFDSGARAAPGGRPWAELSGAERARIVNGHRLAFMDDAPVNWCPALGTVLANEEVTAQGRSERGNHPVFRRPMRQWMLRITAYAGRLLDDLGLLDWPDSIKTMQRNWIGRSEGALVSFPVAGPPPDGDAGAPAGKVSPPPGGAPEGKVVPPAADAPEGKVAPPAADASAGRVSAAGGGVAIDVFTTRPDTLHGTTYMVLAPEHPLVDMLAADAWPAGTDPAWTAGAPTPAEAVAAYRARVDQMSDDDRRDGLSKTGVYLGAEAVVPVNGSRVPVFIADYVLMGYGTGAVMAVPGEDERDWVFAEKFGLPIIRTVQPPPDHPAGEAYTGEGPSVNSDFLDGLDVAAAKSRIIEWLAETGFGSAAVTYKLRDWLFSRQRYWGEPFPVVFDDDGLPVGLPEEMLPVELPDLADWAPRALEPDSDPEPPLSRVEHWAEVELDLDGAGPRRYRRELNTMPQWAGSCWYYLRYLDPDNDAALVDPEVERYWMSDSGGVGGVGGVDLYVGGVEHAVLHLLYARFWHKVLYDLGHVSGPEPFKRLVNQGYIQAAAYQDERGVYVPAEEVEGSPAEGFAHRGRPVTRAFGKMGKSLKNSVTPDDMYASYGADTLRLYEMFMGPITKDRPWETRSVVGSQRMLQRVWRNVVDEQTGRLRVSDEPLAGDDGLLRLVHRTIHGVRADMEGLRFNTAIAKITELNNELTRRGGDTPREAADAMVRMLAPVVPHFAEELWQRLRGSQGDARGGLAEAGAAKGLDSVTRAEFPAADEALLSEESFVVPVQVNGRVRGRVTLSASAGEAEAVATALAEPNVAARVAGRRPRRQMYVPGRIVTLVV